jgi:hypothetical protein
VYSIELYVIKFVSDLQQVSGFPPSTPVSFTNKTDRHDVSEIWMKVGIKHHNPNPLMMKTVT